MGFLDKAKAAAEQAASKAKEEYDDLQLKRELSQAYNAFGKTTFGSPACESRELPRSTIAPGRGSGPGITTSCGSHGS